jgi:NAD(P)-dependent dehydrogenase (short-subunit alcohol dehydrogenase family)
MNDLAERVAIITGAVGNLGQAVAEAFRQRGAKTVLVDRGEDRLRAAYPQLVGARDHLLAGGVDAGSPESVGRMASAALQRFGRIDVLVNTVGGFRGGTPVQEENPETWDFLMNTNFRTALFTCRAVIPAMLKQQGGKIVNIGSRAALAGSAGLAAYSVSKTAVLRLTESLSGELKRHGINVNCVLPGTIDTPQNRAAMPNADVSTWVAPAALADVIVFLASDAARAIHGAALPVYGLG